MKSQLPRVQHALHALVMGTCAVLSILQTLLTLLTGSLCQQMCTWSGLRLGGGLAVGLGLGHTRQARVLERSARCLLHALHRERAHSS